ncbi:MAG: hypothetical protein IKT52_11345 [Oscillospiraceae bacterium]|nr:hypothetical protein [Oscillospiraceae bacterium]
MKLFRRTFALLMVLALMMSMTISVFAVTTVEELQQAINNGETDITIQNNIDGDYDVIDLGSSDVTIGADTDAAGNKYELSKVEFTSTSGGSVEINTNVNDTAAAGNAQVTINGNVDDGVQAMDEASVTVNGDVTGTSYGVVAEDEATVIVNGNVDGGTYGVLAEGSSTIAVDGNVAGGDATGDGSIGGVAIGAVATATVTVTGNATGGDALGKNGVSGPALVIASTEAGQTPGSVIVYGDVRGGEALGEDSTQLPDIYVGIMEDGELPSISVGSYETIGGVALGGSTSGRDLTDEELEVIIEDIQIIEKECEPEPVQAGLESHYGYLLQAILMAKAGDEVTTDVGARKSIPSAIIDAARIAEIKLIIKWTGGDDLVITKDFTAELSGDVLLTDLAEMLKK